MSARHEEDGRLVPECEEESQEEFGRLARASRELPSPESLGIPPDVLAWFARKTGGDLRWVVLFWDIWRKRKAPDQDILEKFCKETGYRP